jgi:hypothetical protein
LKHGDSASPANDSEATLIQEHFRVVGSLLIATACWVGCGKRPDPLPTTYPVHGKITYKDGTPARGGMVQFQPEAEPSVTTTGTIENDGTYSLTTKRNGLRAEGAVAGSNRVLLILAPAAADGGDQRSGNGATSQQNGLFLNYPTPSNVEPRDNEINLVVARLPP